MGTIDVIHHYPVDAGRLWHVATDLSTLSDTTRGLVRYRGLPRGAVREGTEVAYEVSLLGLTPWRPYNVAVVAMDARRMHFATEEWGAGIERWRHDLRVEPTDTGAMLIERVEVAAEHLWFTPIATGFADLMYRRRHGPRLALLTGGEGGGPGELAPA